jgi:hypothetical protein
MDRQIFKNLLEGKVCLNCSRVRESHETKVRFVEEKYCLRFLGESIGWQWWPTSKDKTCEDWKSEI